MTSLPNIPQEIPLRALSGDLLRARVARAQMYLVQMEPKEGATSSPSEELQYNHLSYLVKLERAGLLFGAGPIESGGVIQAVEIAVITASSREHAEYISRADPLHVAGLRVNSVRSYTINEGVACYFARAMAGRARAVAAEFDEGQAVGLSGEDLLARAAGVQLYLVPLEPADKPRPPEDTATMDAHFVWLRENEMSAKLLGCGPLQSAKPLAAGVWGGGLGILATSRAEADDIARREPSGVAGYRELSVIPWTLDYGLAGPIAASLVTLNGLPF